MMYAEDYDDCFPFVDYKVAFEDPVDPFGVFYPLKSYLRKHTVLRCPAGPGGDLTTSYAINGTSERGLCGAIWWSRHVFPTAKVGDVRSPSSVILVTDCAVTGGTGGASGNMIRTFASTVFKPGYHEGGMNFAFVDGHVKWIDTKSVPEDATTWKEKKISFDPSYVP